MLKELVVKNRSYRRFDGKTPVTDEMMDSLVGLARLCPSSRNQQALKFMPINEAGQCEKLFPCLAWAGYLIDWPGPDIEEHPTGYIIILGDTTLGTKFDIDLGICAQTILMGAVEMNFGGCMIGSIKREQVKSLFDLPGQLEILLILALGRPVEKVVIEPIIEGDIRYWRDLEQVHHVPKRSLEDIRYKPDMF
ncbi:MAG: nitroreductase family protein [Bacteroidales bacterium]|jgi:nitroreductase